MRKALTLSTLALAIGLIPLAHADHGKRMQRLDGDGDGLISREEFARRTRGPSAHVFEHGDLDGDGQLTREEMELAAKERQAKATERAARLFAEMDADGDGVVYEYEVLDHAFARIDANEDGFIDRDEERAARAQWRERRPGPKP
ncbi:MAG: EF-hand domain-containing protein [Halieaceae bacterium]|jgi:Ca2+-binding EF-hand superfamily protein|nr:EF-hand domain-containing protein [Halieaceae bacterium]